MSPFARGEAADSGAGPGSPGRAGVGGQQARASFGSWICLIFKVFSGSRSVRQIPPQAPAASCLLVPAPHLARRGSWVVLPRYTPPYTHPVYPPWIPTRYAPTSAPSPVHHAATGPLEHVHMTVLDPAKENLGVVEHTHVSGSLRPKHG